MHPQTFEEACKNRGYNPDQIIPDVSMVPEKHQASIIAFVKLIVITEAIREGKEPDWNDDDESKWYPWFDMEVDDNNPSGFRFDGSYYGYANASTTGGSRLCYPTEKDSKYAATQFESLWRDMMVIPK